MIAPLRVEESSGLGHLRAAPDVRIKSTMAQVYLCVPIQPKAYTEASWTYDHRPEMTLLAVR